MLKFGIKRRAFLALRFVRKTGEPELSVTANNRKYSGSSYFLQSSRKSNREIKISLLLLPVAEADTGLQSSLLLNFELVSSGIVSID